MRRAIQRASDISSSYTGTLHERLLKVSRRQTLVANDCTRTGSVAGHWTRLTQDGTSVPPSSSLSAALSDGSRSREYRKQQCRLKQARHSTTFVTTCLKSIHSSAVVRPALLPSHWVRRGEVQASDVPAVGCLRFEGAVHASQTARLAFSSLQANGTEPSAGGTFSPNNSCSAGDDVADLQ